VYEEDEEPEAAEISEELELELSPSAEPGAPSEPGEPELSPELSPEEDLEPELSEEVLPPDELGDAEPSEEEVVEPSHERHAPSVSVPPRVDYDEGRLSEDSGAFERITSRSAEVEARDRADDIPTTIVGVPDSLFAREESPTGEARPVLSGVFDFTDLQDDDDGLGRLEVEPKTAPRGVAGALLAGANTRGGSLEYMSGAERGRRVAIVDRLTVGQGSHCGMPIPGDTRLSPLHCTVERTAAGFVLVDAGSANGTVVNGQRITEIDLAGGEVIMVGRTVLRFQLGNDE
jgi:hypothetical protein